jgi:hypothetical protein
LLRGLVMVIRIRLIKPLSIVAFVLFCGSFGRPQSVAPTTPTPENWKESIYNVSEADKTGNKDVVRQERSAAFNDQWPDAPKLDSLVTKTGSTRGTFPPISFEPLQYPFEKAMPLL